MQSKTKQSADVSMLVDEEVQRLWARLADLSGHAAFAYPAILAQGPSAPEVCRALNQALQGLAAADEAIALLTRLMARIQH